jgi:hypothetical protein
VIKPNETSSRIPSTSPSQRPSDPSSEASSSSNDINSSSQSNSRHSHRSRISKPAKPPFFDGKDSTVSTVKAWIFSVREYIELSDIEAVKQTRYTAGYLTETIKTWYINTYGSITPLSDLDTFLNVFKKFYLKINNENDAANRIEKIKQGKISISEYSTEFKIQLSELDDTDTRWIKRHFLRDLQSDIHVVISPQVSTINDLDRLIAITQDTHDTLQ